MTTPRSDAAATGDPAVIRADIERTRAELGDTVQALAGKADVKARAQEAAHAAKERAKERLTDGAHAARDVVADGAHAVAEGAQIAGERAAGEVRHAGEVARRHPGPAMALLAGVAAAVTGLVIGLRRRAERRRAMSLLRSARRRRPAWLAIRRR